MIVALILFLAARAASTAPTVTPTASVTPTPSTPTPIPSPTPVTAADPYRPRALSEIARDRRLGRLSGVAVVTTPEPEPAPSGTAPARRSGPVRVVDVQENGAVTDGFVSVYGTVRNTGHLAACRVRIFLKVYDGHGVLLSTGETTTDLKIVGPGEAVPFGGFVQVPAGVRGSRERKPDPLDNGTTPTNWKRVGRVEAEIMESSEECS